MPDDFDCPFIALPCMEIVLDFVIEKLTQYHYEIQFCYVFTQ